MIVFFPEDIFSEYVQLGPSTAGALTVQGPRLLLRWTAFAIIPLPARSYLKNVWRESNERKGNKGYGVRAMSVLCIEPVCCHSRKRWNSSYSSGRESLACGP